MMLGIIQARIGSSRLPGKVLLPLSGKPMLSFLLERIQKAKRIDKLVVATSISDSDDPIEQLCKLMGIDCYRGSLNNVLDRFYHAALTYKPDSVIRFTGDCPLHDPMLIDEFCECFTNNKYDYLCNTVKPTFPDGYDMWAASFSALYDAWNNAILPSDLEHVFPYIRSHKKRFKTGSFEHREDNSRFRVTVDHWEDYQLVTKVVDEVSKTDTAILYSSVLDFLKNNNTVAMSNSDKIRDAGYMKSLDEDKDVAKKNKSEECFLLRARANRFIPGITQLLSKRPDQYSDGVWPTYFKKATGAEVWDADGNHYYDMSLSGIGANILGYADSDVNRAVNKVISDGNNCTLNSAEEIMLAEKFCGLHKWAEQVRYARTGGESTTVAIRIARATTGRDKIAFCGYHGWHDWYLSANLTSNNGLDGHLLKGLQPAGVPKVLAGTSLPFHYNKLDELEKIISEHGNDLAAVIMEPLRNMMPDKGFLEGVRRLTENNGSVLIFDEISSGFRMNCGGAHLILGVDPDMAVFGKSITNGYPLGVIIGKKSAMEGAQKSFISSTYWTERIGPAAALACIDKYQRCEVEKRLDMIGRKLQEAWLDSAKAAGLKIKTSGFPALSHFDFEDNNYPLESKAFYIQTMLEHGLLASNHFYAMYAHNMGHIELYYEAARDAFTGIRKILDGKKGFYGYLKGKPSNPSFTRLN